MQTITSCGPKRTVMIVQPHRVGYIYILFCIVLEHSRCADVLSAILLNTPELIGASCLIGIIRLERSVPWSAILVI